MNDGLITALLAYGFVGIIWVGCNLLDLWWEKDSFCPDRELMRKSARNALLTPAWPVIAIMWLVRVLSDLVRVLRDSEV